MGDSNEALHFDGTKWNTVAVPTTAIGELSDVASCGPQDAWLVGQVGLAFGSLTARALQADAATIAVSGKRLTGRDGMPDVWEGTLGGARRPAWDFARWKPEAVVINLGTNDWNARSTATFSSSAPRVPC